MSNESSGDPGAVTPVLFQLLVEKLRWGRYKGQQLPASLQLLLLPSNGPSPPSKDAPVGLVLEFPGNGGDGGGGRPPGREGNNIWNPRHIQRLKLRADKNTRGLFCNTALPTVNGCVFYKCWHLGMSCFSGCSHVSYHVLPPAAMIDTVATILATERTAATAAAV